MTKGFRQLDRQIRYMMGTSADIGAEAPVRIHGPEPDFGHDRTPGRQLTLHPPTYGHGVQARGHLDDQHDGLGAPEYHASFLRWLAESGVCVECEGDQHRYPCAHMKARLRRVPARTNQRRLKRAFRQLRDLDPGAYDITWLVVARHMSWRAAVTRINDSRYARGQEPYSDSDMAVFTHSGVSLLAAAF